MRRSKAAVSVEVKQVIGALCRLLAATGLEAVPPPETFRRAKFGGGLEVVRSSYVFIFYIYWRSILYKLLSISLHFPGKCCTFNSTSCIYSTALVNLNLQTIEGIT